MYHIHVYVYSEREIGKLTFTIMAAVWSAGNFDKI